MRFFASLIVLLCLGVPAWSAQSTDAVKSPLSTAEQRADRLDGLFAKLHGAAEGSDPAEIESQIWQLWGQSDSATAEVLLVQGSAAMTAGEFTAAEKVLSALISAFPDYAEALNKRATLYFLMKRNADSLVDIERVLELEPRHFGALSGKGMILRAEGKNSAALAIFRDALKINPHMAGAKAAVDELGKLERDI